MQVLLTGIDGYSGWPLALAISKKFKNFQIIGVDNLMRRKWVKECKAVSAIPIASMKTRINTAKKVGFKNIKFIKGDLSNAYFVENLFKKYKFNIVIHLASQPSAPYANSSLKRASFTLKNNQLSTLNIIWSIKKFCDKNTKFIFTSTTGVYGQPNFKIPEGFVIAENQKIKDSLPFSQLGGSWYHITKSNDINNLLLANRLWGLKVLDLRTAIIYGTETEETSMHKNLNTRFDFDYNFGVVINRFCAMSAINNDVTVYGKGLLKRPFISLSDFINSIINLINYKQTRSFEVFNQTTELLGIKFLGETIVKESQKLGLISKVRNIENPRVEKETHQMQMTNTRFLKLLRTKPVNFSKECKKILKKLIQYNSIIKKNKKTFI